MSEDTRALAAAPSAGASQVVELDLGHDTYRTLTTALGPGRGALQVGADIEGSRRVLTGMAIEIAWVSALVLAAAALAGWLLARRITRRLVRLTLIVEDVSASRRIDREVPVEGRDEVGRLSASFNSMLARLADAREAQDRMVQDAAHELRTPLTSLRTNASVLRRVDELAPATRERLVDDVVGETRELSHLVDELVELALARRDDESEQPVVLGEAVATAVARVRRRTGRAVVVDADGRVVLGHRQALERAIGNLLENAAKFDAEHGEPLEVTARNGTVTVSDRGPGITAEDTVRVFDRFYRADAARSLPGSGLGLAIVHDVAQAHGGMAFVRQRAGGGATVGFTVDPARLSATEATETAGNTTTVSPVQAAEH